MGKFPYSHTDSDDDEDTSSSVENVEKKKKFSNLKYTSGNFRKKKGKLQSKSEPEDTEIRSRLSHPEAFTSGEETSRHIEAH
ncbi:unnamed protein product [Leptidea sinapis]|uniref:Uncharacterized protein n=1 Tax=Leptidea sinapis TaxID=189913 RepID=A0A5E4Q8W2_9NEOP|nr:unnamed protein product [Leptidea sinapis]